MSKYASQTEVNPGRSKESIERTLMRYGASAFAYGQEDGRAMVQFKVENMVVRFIIPMPDPNSDEFRYSETGRERAESARWKAYEQAIRQKWRVLDLVIKAKLEAVESEIVTFEQEFLAHLVLPDGATVGDRVLPELENTLNGAEMPKLLPQ